MPTPNLNNPQVQEKINNALRYGNVLKEKALEHNTIARSLIDNYIRKIHTAVQRGEDYTQYIDALLFDLGFLLDTVFSDSVTLAVEKEGQNAQLDTLLYTIPLATEQCRLSYYQVTLDKYRSILSNEIIFAIESGYSHDLAMFLSNPQGYIADKKRGLEELKTSITDVSRGVSYSFLDNINKLVVSAAALSFTNAQMHLWKENSDIVGYMGVRNSNYPCALCDSYAYQYIPLSSGMIYPLHNRCVCSVVYLTRNETL